MKSNKAIFGPAGNSQSFYDEGHKSTVEMPSWLSKRGLSAFEYSFGRGVNIGAEKAREIGSAAKDFGITMSAHAPYYINFASQNPENVEKSFGYVLKSLEALQNMGGSRLVVHVGSASKIPREEALVRTRDNLAMLADKVREAGFEDMTICPETMGKYSQIGTVEEIAALCTIDDIFVPCVDFGHVNCYTQGKLKTRKDFAEIIEHLYSVTGKKKTDNMHIHFSKIQFGSSGEIRHLTFADTEFGPPYEPLMQVIADFKMTPVVICESDGVMAEDALAMKNCFDQIK